MEDFEWTVKEFEWFPSKDTGLPRGLDKNSNVVFGLNWERDNLLAKLLREAIGTDQELVLDVLGRE